MKFNEYYNQEQIDEGKAMPHKYATEVEGFIVKAANRIPFNAKERQFEEVSKAIVNRFNFPEGAVWTEGHEGQLNQEYLDTMKRLGRTTRSDVKPKTDFVIGGERISLKMNKGWLFAHFLFDAQGCLEYTLNRNTKAADEIKKELINTIEEIRKKEKNIAIDKNRFEGSETNKDELNKKFIDIMEKNKEGLKIEFLKNGLTGEFKYKQDDIAVADKLMVVKFTKAVPVKEAIKDIRLIDLKNSFIKDIKTDNDYIKHLADNSEIVFMYSYKNKKHRFDIADRTKKANEYQVDIEKAENLDESEIFDKIVSLIKQGYEKAKGQIQKWINYLIEQLKKGVSYFLRAIGINVSVQLQDEIEF